MGGGVSGRGGLRVCRRVGIERARDRGIERDLRTGS